MPTKRLADIAHLKDTRRENRVCVICGKYGTHKIQFKIEPRSGLYRENNPGQGRRWWWACQHHARLFALAIPLLGREWIRSTADDLEEKEARLAEAERAKTEL